MAGAGWCNLGIKRSSWRPKWIHIKAKPNFPEYFKSPFVFLKFGLLILHVGSFAHQLASQYPPKFPKGNMRNPHHLGLGWAGALQRDVHHQNSAYLHSHMGPCRFLITKNCRPETTGQAYINYVTPATLQTTNRTFFISAYYVLDITCASLM